MTSSSQDTDRMNIFNYWLAQIIYFMFLFASVYYILNFNWGGTFFNRCI